MKGGTPRSRMLWTFVVTSLALVMVTLDNLVVTTALPVIRTDLGASIEGLEWTVNAYTLTFAVLLLTGAALGDRFGRRRMFAIGLAIFTLASAVAALAPSIEVLVAARAIQGVGGAIITPLTLTILSAAVPAEKRGLALGAWGGIGGLAVALGPLVGGAVVSGLSWQWIFWINVPIGLVLIPLALAPPRRDATARRRSSTCRASASSAPACSASSGASSAATARAGRAPRSSPRSRSAARWSSLFVLWELRAEAPMLPMRFFRNRTFALTNVASLLMFFGMFGSIFLLAQFFQTVQGYSPFGSGLRILPWTAMPIFVAPIAGALSDRIGGPPLMALGARAAGDRARLDRGGRARRRRRTADVRRPVHPLRHRDGALLRAGRERRPLVGQAGGRGPGLGREQRDPRARRRLRRRGAGLDLRALRRVRVRPDVRRRARRRRSGSARSSSPSARWPRSRSRAGSGCGQPRRPWTPSSPGGPPSPSRGGGRARPRQGPAQSCTSARPTSAGRRRARRRTGARAPQSPPPRSG